MGEDLFARDPIAAAHCARSPRWWRRSGRTPPGPAVCAAPIPGPGRDTPVVSWDAKRQLVKVAPLATWSDEQLMPTSPSTPAANHCSTTVQLHRCDPVLCARAGPMPGPAGGPVWPRPNAGSTCELDRDADGVRHRRGACPSTGPGLRDPAPGATLWFTGLPSAGSRPSPTPWQTDDSSEPGAGCMCWTVTRSGHTSRPASASSAPTGI